MSRFAIWVRLTVPSRAGIDDQAGEPAGREVRDGVIAGECGLRIGIDQQHALANVRQERGQIGRQRGLADPARRRNDRQCQSHRTHPCVWLIDTTGGICDDP